MHPSIGAMFVMRTSIPSASDTRVSHKTEVDSGTSVLSCAPEGARKESWAQHSPGTIPLTQGDVQELMIHHADPQEHRPALQRKGSTRKLFCLLQQGGCDPHAACVTNSTSTKLHKWSGLKADVDLSSCLRQKMLYRSPQDVCVIHSIVCWWLSKGWSKAQGTFEEPGSFCSWWLPCHTGGTMRSQRLDIDKTLHLITSKGQGKPNTLLSLCQWIIVTFDRENSGHDLTNSDINRSFICWISLWSHPFLLLATLLPRRTFFRIMKHIKTTKQQFQSYEI